MKSIYIFIVSIFIISNPILGQVDSSKIIVRNGIWFIPTKADKINGLAIGPIESIVFNKNQTVNGLTIDIVGLGLFSLAGIGYDEYEKYFSHRNDSLILDSLFRKYELSDTLGDYYVHNGLVISGTGMLTEKVNGVFLSPWCGWADCINGISVNGFVNMIDELNGVVIGVSNDSFKVHGLQIGLFNSTVKLHGIQIGLWNKNLKRSLPFVNWNFEK